MAAPRLAHVADGDPPHLIAFSLTAGVSMLLLVSTLFLWEHVASNPSDAVPTEALYDYVVKKASATNVLVANMHDEVNLGFLRRVAFANKPCHTDVLESPESPQEVHNTKIPDLLKSVAIITHAWVKPLTNLVSAVPALPGASDNLLRTATGVMEGNNMLREGLKPILNRTHVVVEDNAYPEWSGESDLQSSDEDTLRSAVHSLTTCLKGDMQKIINYLRDMWCRASVRVDCPDRD
ncbi:prolactin-3D1 isoform X2 [Cricetulus griseus]|uniref:Prolactin-3D1 isoform X2 n=2 Tax=Cricetulus griseus TaxID=10029 RepID=A0A9J7FRS2_CRIGR|nr:prolactin-3D1 isoform X2 [Cricetulus griseus]